MMRCPDCELALLTAEVGPSERRVEVDYCNDGHGCWFDEGEIESLLRAQTPVLEALPRRGHGRRRCPRCRSRLLTVHVDDGLELDVCARGDGIWLDPGELEALATALGARAGTPEGGLSGNLAAALRRLSSALGNDPGARRVENEGERQ
jgi:Zn-finger nucleic acid-binding protein